MGINGYDADLFDAAEFGDIEYAKLLLGHPGCDGKPIDVNAQDTEGTTILMLASYYGHEDMVRLILEHGADPNLKDSKGRTALMRAGSSNHTNVVGLLRNAGAAE
jgi:ankyrin repeat protein